MRIKLDSGREIKVNNFEFGYTYGGMLCGEMNETLNRRIFGDITIPTNWGEDRNVLKLEPTQAEFENQLKPVYYIVWLDSNVPSDSKYHGSSLIVIWLGGEPVGNKIEDIIFKGIKDIDWDSTARDYEY